MGKEIVVDQNKILLKITLDETGLGDLKLDTFKDRLCIQKKIYLVQIAGLDLGYRYNWYLKGPYCPKLTDNVYLLKEEIETEKDEYEEYKLNEKAERYVEKAKGIWALPTNIETDEAEWVELLASLHYLKMIAYWPEEPTKELVVKRLLSSKPEFEQKEELVKGAWSRLEELGLFEKKSMIS